MDRRLFIGSIASVLTTLAMKAKPEKELSWEQVQLLFRCDRFGAADRGSR